MPARTFTVTTPDGVTHKRTSKNHAYICASIGQVPEDQSGTSPDRRHAPGTWIVITWHRSQLRAPVNQYGYYSNLRLVPVDEPGASAGPLETLRAVVAENVAAGEPVIVEEPTPELVAERAMLAAATLKVAVVETDVLGVKAYNARCLSCGWESPRYDREKTAVKHAKAHSHDAMLAADAVISRLAERLDHSASGRLSAGPRGSAEVCFRDAETCFGRGDYVHAIERAERGLLYADDALELDRQRFAGYMTRLASGPCDPEPTDADFAAGQVESLAEGLELAAEFHAAERTLPERAFVDRALSIMSDDPADGSEPELERLRRLPDTAPLERTLLAMTPDERSRHFAGLAPEELAGVNLELFRLNGSIDEAHLARRELDSALARLELVQRELTDVCRDRDELLDRVSELTGEGARLRGQLGRVQRELERCQLGDYPPPTPEGA